MTARILRWLLKLIKTLGRRAAPIVRIYLARMLRKAANVRRELDHARAVLRRERERWRREGMNEADRAQKEVIDEVIDELEKEADELQKAIERLRRELENLASREPFGFPDGALAFYDAEMTPDAKQRVPRSSRSATKARKGAKAPGRRARG